MRTAKAAVYEAPNTPFVMKEFPLRPVHRGEALVKVTMSTICRSDIHSYEGRRPNPCPEFSAMRSSGSSRSSVETSDRICAAIH